MVRTLMFFYMFVFLSCELLTDLSGVILVYFSVGGELYAAAEL